MEKRYVSSLYPYGEEGGPMDLMAQLERARDEAQKAVMGTIIEDNYELCDKLYDDLEEVVEKLGSMYARNPRCPVFRSLAEAALKSFENQALILASLRRVH